jgi:nitrite reductase/ring-hydroxylating ferredoxin subunit
VLTESVGPGPAVEIEVARITERIVAGDILVIRGLLQAIGWFDRLVRICRADLIALVGAERAGEVVAARFERIHEQLSVDELFEFNRSAMRHLSPAAPEIIRDFAHQVLQRRGTFAECYPNMRTIVPHDVAARHAVAFTAEDRRRGAGKVTLHGPHYDSWHRHPLNTINLWCAIGPVRHGNGMVVYPEVWGKHLPCGPNGRIRRDQVLGRTINFALEPGDGVVFLANHLHGSEINVTRETRCVISMRMTLERPDFPDSHAYRYVYSDWIGTALGRWARLRVQLSRGYILDRAKKAFAARRRKHNGPEVFTTGPQRRFRPTHDTSKFIPDSVEVAWDDSGRVGVMSADALPMAAIRPVDDELCVVRTMSGYGLFKRSCPHEGADLAGGRVTSDGKLVCPWHNLHFDSDTGESPCRSITKLSVTRGLVEGATVRFVLLARSPRSAHR